MLIVTHIIIALTSIIIATLTFIRPTQQKLLLSYGAIFGTVVSGTLLMVTFPSHMLQSCIEGVAYLSVVSIATIATHVKIRRFATVKSN